MNMLPNLLDLTLIFSKYYYKTNTTCFLFLFAHVFFFELRYLESGFIIRSLPNGS